MFTVQDHLRSTASVKHIRQLGIDTKHFEFVPTNVKQGQFGFEIAVITGVLVSSHLICSILREPPFFISAVGPLEIKADDFGFVKISGKQTHVSFEIAMPAMMQELVGTQP